MVRHVISVCIFCFICATHSPCASHASVEHEQLRIGRDFDDSYHPPLVKNLQISSRERLKRHSSPPAQPYNDLADPTDNERIRHQRASGSDAADGSGDDRSDFYLQKLFEKFGDGDMMTLKGFEELVKNLNLHKAISNNLKDHHIDDHSDINIKTDLNNSRQTNTTCFNKDDLKKVTQANDIETDIDHKIFLKACPTLVYSLLSEDCSHEYSHDHNDQSESSVLNGYVWFYSILAVVVISACGLLALVVIPLMQKRFYKPLIQFLVALAVGTLAGDALLHLLPHAMNGGLEAEHTHGSQGDENMWKGFVAMMGLTFFFVMERFILLIGKWRKRHQKKAHHSHVRVVNETCMDKYNSIPYCFQDIMQDTKSKYYDSDKTGTTMVDISSNSDGQSFKKSNSVNMDKPETNQNMTQCTSDNAVCTESNKMLPSNNKHEDIMVILREHETAHHGHSHAHGHVHAAPQNFSAVAWMVIMGDGLHNFTDGMAIGAAFSGSVAGGFSTTVAVFCHELPHELGDFAMLLKAGMTIKQAVFYNLLSSLLCVLGNVFGVWLGNTEYGSSWVFAAAAGMFLYIALVDMIPELSSAHEDESNITQCILHLSGLFLGVGIMTLIAFYEHDLKHIFKETM